MALERKDLLGMRGMSAAEIIEILDTGALMKTILLQNSKRTPHLQGKSIVTLFYENSTRTRMSFELACKYMSAAAANISASTSSVQKGETLIDTGRTLDQMGTDIIIIRHPMTAAPHLLAKNTRSGIINAGDGTNEHPTQALLDLYTVREKFGDFKGLKVAIIGDVDHSRVARSNAFALKELGAEVCLCAPPTLLSQGIEALATRVTTNLKEAMTGANVVMALRMQKERQGRAYIPSVREYYANWAVNRERMEKWAETGAIVMHPGPMNRGVEIDSHCADSAESVIETQVQNGVAIRMALLYMLTRRTNA